MPDECGRASNLIFAPKSQSFRCVISMFAAANTGDEGQEEMHLNQRIIGQRFQIIERPVASASNSRINMGVAMFVQYVRPSHCSQVPYGPLSGGRPLMNSLLLELAEAAGITVSYARNVEIYGEGEPSEYFYLVVNGAVRTYKVLVDGRRQVCAFYLSDEFFGLEPEEAHMFSAEAIVNSKILMIKRSSVMAEAERNREIAGQLWAMTGSELKRVQSHLLLLIKTAKERVAEFLLEMAARVPRGEAVELPMSRQDIADYLGLTIETVSRVLSDLERNAAIVLPNSRRVVLRDQETLRRYGG